MADAAQPAKEHKRFTVERTSLIGKIDGELPWAIYHGGPPRETDGGRILPMRFPLLILSPAVDQPKIVALQIADMLNESWPVEVAA